MENKKEYEIYLFNSQEESEFTFFIKTKDFSEVKALVLLGAEIFKHVYAKLNDEIVLSFHDYSEE